MLKKGPKFPTLVNATWILFHSEPSFVTLVTIYVLPLARFVDNSWVFSLFRIIHTE